MFKIKSRSKDEDRNHIKNKDALLLDYYMQPDRTYILDKTWSSEPSENIYKLGYLKADKFLTEIKFYNTKAFVKFHDWKVCDAAKHGNFMTSATLYDFLKSDSSSRFIAGMTKISFAPIDLKMLILAIPVILGIIIGMVYFMGGH